MPVYLLGSRTQRVQIPDQPLSVSISGSVEGVAVVVNAGAATPNVVRVNAHVVVILTVDEGGLTVGVQPVGAPTFGDDTIVHLSIGPDSPGELDPEQVCFDPVDVSGTPGMELAALTARGGRIEVATHVIGDVALNPLAGRARTVARRRAGKHRQAPAGSLTIAVDASASMKAAFGNGSVSAAIDMIIGVADVAGIADVGAVLVGTHCTPVDAAAAELAEAVTGTTVRWSAGARWSALPHTERTLVLTDRDSAVKAQFPVMCISGDGRLGASGPLLAPPTAGVSAHAHLSANPAIVDEVTAALLPVLTRPRC